MSKVSKDKSLTNNSNLICITGFMGSGKSTFAKFLQDLGFSVFIADEFVHKLYKKNEKGYELIKKYFGDDFTNSVEVDRKKLKDLILNDSNQKILLEKIMNKIIYDEINELKRKKELIFVELGTYLFFEDYFKNLFNKVVVVETKNKNYKNNYFKNFSNIEKFSTKPVGNLKNPKNSNIFYADFI
ncbi:MAG: dephospho-CoA kinase, partial [Malacoplasma sp.]|nr:dephospho-CoA kinase [Malacoplasma sp.]